MPKWADAWQKAANDVSTNVPALKAAVRKYVLKPELDVLDNYVFWLGQVKEMALKRVGLEKELQKGSPMKQVGAAAELRQLTGQLDKAGKEAITAGAPMKKSASSISGKIDKLGDAINEIDRATVSAAGRAAVTALVNLGVKVSKTASGMNMDTPENWVAEIKQDPSAGRVPTGGDAG